MFVNVFRGKIVHIPQKKLAHFMESHTADLFVVLGHPVVLHQDITNALHVAVVRNASRSNTLVFRGADPDLVIKQAKTIHPVFGLVRKDAKQLLVHTLPPEKKGHPP